MGKMVKMGKGRERKIVTRLKELKVRCLFLFGRVVSCRVYIVLQLY